LLCHIFSDAFGFSLEEVNLKIRKQKVNLGLFQMDLIL
jgi:hypothetical protein